MDDRHAYMLNELWTRQYDLGRVLRFRHIRRGRQAVCYEVLTAEQHTFTAYLFGPEFDPVQLAAACQALVLLDKQRFSVVPMVPMARGEFLADGPQGAALVVGLEATGQEIPADQWSLHDVTQLGLRLGWMHRLLVEQCPVHTATEPAAALVAARAHTPVSRRLGALNPVHVDALGRRLESLPPAAAWAHGDVQPAAMLLDSDRQIRTIVDWALLHPGDPLEDLIDAFTQWCMGDDGLVNAEAGRALLESYRTLRPLEDGPWETAALRWCAQRIIDACHDRRPLPRGFATLLAEPRALATALELCEAK